MTTFSRTLIRLALPPFAVFTSYVGQVTAVSARISLPAVQTSFAWIDKTKCKASISSRFQKGLDEIVIGFTGYYNVFHLSQPYISALQLPRDTQLQQMGPYSAAYAFMALARSSANS